MKYTDKKKPVSTIPKGVWESGRPEKKENKNGASTPAVDLQGNGYPTHRQSK